MAKVAVWVILVLGAYLGGVAGAAAFFAYFDGEVEAALIWPLFPALFVLGVGAPLWTLYAASIGSAIAGSYAARRYLT